MKALPKPTRKDTINLRIFRHDGAKYYKDIVGVFVYPLVIHRPTDDYDLIASGKKSRYSSKWNVTHALTGKGFGISSTNWDAVSAYALGMQDEPALLMMSDKTMTEHPCYDQLFERHKELKHKLGL